MKKDEDEFYCGETEEVMKKINFTEEYRKLAESIKMQENMKENMKENNREDELLDALRIIRDDLKKVIVSMGTVLPLTVLCQEELSYSIRTLKTLRDFANDASL